MSNPSETSQTPDTIFDSFKAILFAIVSNEQIRLLGSPGYQALETLWGRVSSPGCTPKVAFEQYLANGSYRTAFRFSLHPDSSPNEELSRMYSTFVDVDQMIRDASEPDHVRVEKETDVMFSNMRRISIAQISRDFETSLTALLMMMAERSRRRGPPGVGGPLNPSHESVLESVQRCHPSEAEVKHLLLSAISEQRRHVGVTIQTHRDGIQENEVSLIVAKYQKSLLLKTVQTISSEALVGLLANADNSIEALTQNILELKKEDVALGKVRDELSDLCDKLKHSDRDRISDANVMAQIVSGFM